MPAQTFEVKVVSAVRPLIDKMTAALKSGDLAASKDAYEAYDASWNGTEVYVNFRSKELYTQLEVDLQNAIGDGLSKPTPDLASLVPLSEAMAKKYDEILALILKSPPLNPLFDDVTNLRIIRADLRITTAAITANDLPKAKAHFATFKSNVPKALPLIKARSTTAADDTSAALAAADAKFTANGTIDDVKPLVAALTSRYNFGVALVNAAARNADSKKTTYTPEDVTTLTALNDIMIQVNRSMTEYTAGDFAKSGSDAALAAGDSFAKVQPILAAKNGSDVALKTALGAYAALAGAAGDTAKVKAANRTAYEAVFVAQQVIVGQFWADSKLQSVLSALPKS